MIFSWIHRWRFSCWWMFVLYVYSVHKIKLNFGDLVQDYNISNGLAMEMLQYCTKPLTQVPFALPSEAKNGWICCFSVHCMVLYPRIINVLVLSIVAVDDLLDNSDGNVVNWHIFSLACTGRCHHDNSVQDLTEQVAGPNQNFKNVNIDL